MLPTNEEVQKIASLPHALARRRECLPSARASKVDEKNTSAGTYIRSARTSYRSPRTLHRSFTNTLFQQLWQRQKIYDRERATLKFSPQVYVHSTSLSAARHKIIRRNWVFARSVTFQYEVHSCTPPVVKAIPSYQATLPRRVRGARPRVQHAAI